MTGTMRAAVLRAPGEPLELEEIPIPSPQAGEVLIRVTACGVWRARGTTGYWPTRW